MLVTSSGDWGKRDRDGKLTGTGRADIEFVIKAVGADTNEAAHLASLVEADRFDAVASFANGELTVVVTASQEAPAKKAARLEVAVTE